MPADTPRNLTKLAARLAFASFVASLLLGLLLPIYTDEIGWRMQLRAGIDGGVDRMLSDICGANTIAAPPWFMMPLRYLSGWLNTTFADPLYVRIVGVTCALGWAVLLRTLIARIAADERQRNILIAFFFALLGMGILPIMLTMSRPDQIILLAMTAALLVAAIAAQAKADAPRRPVWFRVWFRAWLWPMLIAALGIAAISSHLKGILIAPVILVCIALAGAGKPTRVPRIAAALLFSALSVQAADYWLGRFRCPDDPVLAARLNSENIASALAGGGNWRELARIAITGANPDLYVAHAAARPEPTSMWLPNFRITEAEMVLRFLPLNFAWNMAMLLGLACLVLALQVRWRERRIDLGTAAPPVLAALVLAWGMSQRVKNDYEIIVMLPMIALFALLSITAVAWSPARTRQLGMAAAVVLAVSLAGQIDVARRYLPPLARAAQSPGYVEGQNTSVSAYGYSAIRSQIRQTAKQCGIGTHGRARHPLIDDVTYFAFADSWQPFHYLGVIGPWRGTIRDPIAYLKSRGSEGMILGCHQLSPALQAKAIRNGEFCCISTK